MSKAKICRHLCIDDGKCLIAGVQNPEMFKVISVVSFTKWKYY